MKLLLFVLAHVASIRASPVQLSTKYPRLDEARHADSLGGKFVTMSFEEALRLAALDKQMSQRIQVATSDGDITAGNTPPTTTTSTAGTADMTLDDSEDLYDDQHAEDTDAEHRGVQGLVECPNPRMRVEWRNMADEDKVSYVHAVRCLMEKPAKSGQIPASAGDSLYAQLAWVHVAMAPVAHGTDLFLPWHRYYMLVFEQLLREECGYDRPLPWWDETRDTGNFAGSGIFTDEYYGQLVDVTGGKPEPCVTTGVFANLTVNGIFPQNNTINSTGTTAGQCLTRGERKDLTGQVHWGWVELCEGMTQYTNMRECVEKGIHAFGHNGMGRIMANAAASVSEPSFFLHHALIDWQWKRWQEADRAARTQTIEGCVGPGAGAGGEGEGGGCEPVRLETVLSSQGLHADLTVGDVLKTESYRICYRYDYS